MSLKMGNFGNALEEAKQCIQYDNMWYKVCQFLNRICNVKYLIAPGHLL